MAFDLEKEILKLAAQTKTLAEPVDMDDLVKRGIIKKEGGWWRLLKPNEVPEGLRLRGTEVSFDGKGAKIKIKDSKSFEKVAKQAEKLANRVKTSKKR